MLNLSKCAIAKPVQFSLRPFGGLFNPYSKGCSILCNHPGPNEVKDVVKQVKETWISEGKGHFYREDNHGRNDIDVFDSDIQEHIPEEFFRRYTGSDSRPLTPTPTGLANLVFYLVYFNHISRPQLLVDEREQVLAHI